MNNFKVGDKVTVKMPSGVVVPNGIIISVNFNTQKCEVYWQNPIMACIVDFKDLLPPF